jgi:hypothetical protein
MREDNVVGGGRMESLFEWVVGWPDKDKKGWKMGRSGSMRRRGQRGRTAGLVLVLGHYEIITIDGGKYEGLAYWDGLGEIGRRRRVGSEI